MRAIKRVLVSTDCFHEDYRHLEVVTRSSLVALPLGLTTFNSLHFRSTHLTEVSSWLSTQKLPKTKGCEFWLSDGGAVLCRHIVPTSTLININTRVGMATTWQIPFGTPFAESREVKRRWETRAGASLSGASSSTQVGLPARHTGGITKPQTTPPGVQKARDSMAFDIFNDPKDGAVRPDPRAGQFIKSACIPVRFWDAPPPPATWRHFPDHK